MSGCPTKLERVFEEIWKSIPHESTSLFCAGRRLVRPYFFEFVSHVKSRWAGQNIVDLFSNEFRQRDRQYYVSARSETPLLLVRLCP